MSRSFTVAIDKIQWQQIVDSGARGTALSAGYPDMLIRFPELPARPDSAKVAEHHNVQFDIADSGLAFGLIGLQLTVFDREILQGCEFIADLNIDQPLGTWDLVIDPGTSEHCFNIPQAWLNLARAVKVGGFLSQALPLSMFNHGYWNPNPVAMLDFLEANGFKILQCVLRHEAGLFDLMEHGRKRLKGVPDGAVTVLLAQRVEAVAFRYPQQKLPS